MDSKSIVRKIIMEFNDEPLYLHDIEDFQGSKDYLNIMQASYLRTFKECLSILPNTNSTICELGSYVGILARALSYMGYKVNACDIPFFYDRKHVKEYFEKYDIKSFYFDLKDYKLPFKKSSQDLVIACEIIEHLNFNPLPVIKEINRVLKIGGYFYVAMPNSESFIKRLRYFLNGRQPSFTVEQLFEQLKPDKKMLVGLHWREYSINEVCQMVEPLGFKLVSSKVCSDVNLNYGSFYKNLLKKLIFSFPGCKPNQVVIFKKMRNSKIKF